MRVFNFSCALLFLPLLRAGPGYVDPARCRPCHEAIYASYERTGMGRSIHARPAPEGRFYHRLSNRHYRIADGEMRRHQLDASGREINLLSKSIDFAIGSGNHAATYVHRTPKGLLLELPLSWYSAEGGYWAMSPGYDFARHYDMRREISDACLFCHAAYPREGQSLPEPIDCQRCHGPGEQHLAEPRRGTILNPAALPPTRQLEVCLQCHLETVSRGITDSVRAPGREIFSYRPGEPLAEYKYYFDRADPPGPRFEINHAGYRLLHSACFKRSAGRLTCTACHDPHTARARSNACAGCHAQAHPAPDTRASSDCTTCHMPKRRAQDAVHTVMTDHWIVRQPPPGDPLAPLSEQHVPYEGPLLPFYSTVLPERDPLVRAETLRNRGDLTAALTVLDEALRQTPSEWRLYPPFGDTLLRLNRPTEAIAALGPALAREPGSARLLNIAAVAHGMLGDSPRALELLERARDAHPDLTLTWINLGVTYESLDRPREAIAAYREAIRLQPDSSEARRRLQTLEQRRLP